MMKIFETYFDAFYAYFSKQKQTNFKNIRAFENLGFVIVSTRENIRLIAKASSWSINIFHIKHSNHQGCRPLLSIKKDFNVGSIL